MEATNWNVGHQSKGIHRMNTSEPSHLKKDYLAIPGEDLTKVMTTPPLGPIDAPLPPRWSLEEREEAPRPEDLTVHDLATPEGWVSLGDGRYVRQEDTRGLAEYETAAGNGHGAYRVKRRKILEFGRKAPRIVIDFYQDCKNKQ